MGLSLEKGQSLSLTKQDGGALTNIRLGLGWDSAAPVKRGLFGSKKAAEVDLDASAIFFDASGKVLDTVWFQQLASKDGSTKHTGDNLTGAGDGDDETINVDLSRLPASVQTLVFTVNSFQGDSFDRIANAYCRLIDLTNGKELARYDLTGSGSHTGQVMAKLTRGAGGWDMKALGERTTGRTFHDMTGVIEATL